MDVSVHLPANPKPYSISTRVKFPSAALANTALEVLSVDSELSDRCSKTLSVEGPFLVVEIHAEEARLLRVSIGSFWDMCIVCMKGMQEFA